MFPEQVDNIEGEKDRFQNSIISLCGDNKKIYR